MTGSVNLVELYSCLWRGAGFFTLTRHGFIWQGEYSTNCELTQQWICCFSVLLLLCFCASTYLQRTVTVKMGKWKLGASKAIVGTLYLPKQFELAEGTTPFNFFIWHLVPSICLTVCFCHSPTGLSFQSWTGQNISSRRSPSLAFLSPFLSPPPHQSLLSSPNPPFGLHQCGVRSAHREKGTR